MAFGVSCFTWRQFLDSFQARGSQCWSLSRLAASLVAGPSVASEVAPVNSGGVVGTGYTGPTGTLDGSGRIVVVIDGAFDPGNVMFSGSKIVREACFGEMVPVYTTAKSTCGANSGPWALDPRIRFREGPGVSKYDASCRTQDNTICHYYHGTATAALAAGRQVSPGGGLPPISGIASGAQLVLLKVGTDTGWSVPGVQAALRYVKEVLEKDFPGRIAAVSMSASNDNNQIQDSEPCPTTAFNEWEAALWADGIPVVISSGNKSSANSVGSWACAPSIVAVGSSGVSNPNSFSVGTVGSNASARVKLLAPVGAADVDFADGVWTAWNIFTPPSTVTSGWGKGAGTSFAAPQVAGAFAVLRQRYGTTRTLDQLVSLLQATGVRVQDTRLGRSGVITPRIWLADAVNAREVGRSVWDFTGDKKPDLPVLAADGKSLVLISVNSAGVVDSASAEVVVSTNWSHALTAPVYDFRQAGTNGFLATVGADLYYYHYRPASKSVDAGTRVLAGGADQIAGIAFTHRRTGPGAGVGVVIQKKSGQIVVRSKTETSDLLGAETELVSATAGAGLKLVGIGDVNRDGIPDLVVREPTKLKPEAYLGTAAGGYQSTRLVMDPTNRWGTWTGMQQASLLEDWVAGQPRLGYQIAGNRAVWLIELNNDGTLGATTYNGIWAPNARLLHAPRP